MTPVRFVFGLHLHQPSGNFDHVIAEHVDRVYRPLLEFVEERALLPVALHVSGPLLQWLEDHDRPLHDRIGRLADSGDAELLTSGFYEPVLASLTRADRKDQLAWMRDYLATRFGVTPQTAWLTERVYESELVPELADDGVRHLLVDDWHLLAGGRGEDELQGHFRTEGDGRALNLVPIHEPLRYSVPFEPAEKVRSYFETLHAQGAALAVLGDDGEKFGGWPGTWKRVWEDGWLEDFAAVLTDLASRGTLEFSTVAGAVQAIPSSGLAYLPTASYREMGEWALPPRLFDSPAHPFSNAHWKNFLVRYGEANQMHKKALALSVLSRDRGGVTEVRHAVGRAQSNDPYWHGVFGGIYMKHLRDAAWRALAFAEGTMRTGEPLTVETGDFDYDGEDELWVHSAAFSALVGRDSARIKEFTRFETGVNYADVLTRRWETYHGPAIERGRAESQHPAPPVDDDEAPSIHDLEDSYVLHEVPYFDKEPRSLVVARVVAKTVGPEKWESGDYEALWTWPPKADMAERTDSGGVSIVFRAGKFEKQIEFTSPGDLSVRYQWDPSAFPETASFVVEVSMAHPLEVVAEPRGEVWRYPVVTVPRSERGFERITQGDSVAVVWPVTQGEGVIQLLPAE